jgi:hypothetical protein
MGNVQKVFSDYNAPSSEPFRLHFVSCLFEFIIMLIYPQICVQVLKFTEVIVFINPILCHDQLSYFAYKIPACSVWITPGSLCVLIKFFLTFLVSYAKFQTASSYITTDSS